MSSLTVELRSSASSGNISSLEAALYICKTTHQAPNSLVLILDIVVANFQPDRFPSAAQVNLCLDKHRKWMKTLLLSLDTIVAAFQNTFLPGISPTLPEPLHRKMNEYWGTHIWPALRVIIKYAILDDSQPTVNAVYTPAVLYGIVVYFITAVGQLSLTPQLLSDTGGFVAAVTRLVFRYMDRYSSIMRKRLLPFHNILVANPSEVVRVLEGEPRFVPVLLAFMKEIRTRYDADLEDVVSRDDFDTISALLRSITAIPASAPIVNIIKFQYPEVLDVVLQMWKSSLRGITDAARTSVRAHTSSLHVKTTLSCLDTIASLIERGGTVLHRRVMRKHFLELVLETYRRATAIIHVAWSVHHLPPFLEFIQRYLVHLSVLSPTIHSLEKIDRLGLDDSLTWSEASSVQHEAKKAWIKFRECVADRGRVLEAYKLVASREAPLCGNNKCPRDSLGSPRRCSGCRFMYYCSKKCQAEDRERHKSGCSVTGNKNRHYHDIQDLDYLQYQINHDLQQFAEIYHPDTKNTDGEITCFHLAYEKAPFAYTVQTGSSEYYGMPANTLLAIGRFMDANVGWGEKEARIKFTMGFLNKQTLKIMDISKDPAERQINFVGYDLDTASEGSKYTFEGKSWMTREPLFERNPNVQGLSI